jgi:hypothetical protein
VAVEWYFEHPWVWRDGINGRNGLDYPQIESAMRLERISRTQQVDLFMRLRAIENGYMQALLKDHGTKQSKSRDQARSR